MKKILAFICCIVLVSNTIKSQVVSVEGVLHADSVQYAAPFSLNFCFVNTGSTPIFDSIITANLVISPVNASPQNWQIFTFTEIIPQGIFDVGDTLYISDLNNLKEAQKHELLALKDQLAEQVAEKEKRDLEKLQQEIDEVLGDRAPTMEDIQRLSYTRDVSNLHTAVLS